MRSTLTRNTGFTLLEILVAVAIFAIFSAMAYGGLMRMLSTRERVDTERAFWREISLGFIRMEQDFGLARNRPVRNDTGGEQGAFIGGTTTMRLIDTPNVEFTRGGILVPNGSTADLQRIGYQLSDGKLIRHAWPVLDRAPVSKPESTALLTNVEAFEVRFYQDGTSGGSGSFIDTWPPQSTGSPTAVSLPKAVEITVTLKERGKFVRRFLVGNDK